jgi:hypothetical protein
MKPIKKLFNKSIAIVGLGNSWYEYNIAKTHGVVFDEVWAINAVASVIFHDRVFMMDPASRFLDSDDAGGQTNAMREMLVKHKGPIYTCELDERCPGLVEYPVNSVVEDTKSWYLNNTVAFAVAFAYWNKVNKLSIFGIDFTYQSNPGYAEAGRGCVEFWLAKCLDAGIQVDIAQSSSLLDANIPSEDKLYGYHRLDDPRVIGLDSHGLPHVKKVSEIQVPAKEKETGYLDRYDSHKKRPPEPNKY